jgi:threonine dehydrogenase-like Zn-dependent dehydrogenase
MALVLGLGTIGLQVAQVLRARGVERVIGADLSPLRRAVASELGVTVVSGADLSREVVEVAGDREVDVVFEATGAPALVQGAIELVRAGGTVVVIALYGARAEIDPTLMVQKELTVRGSAIYMPAEFHEAISLLASGRVRSQPLITQRHGLEALGAAFEVQLDRDAAIKVMVSPGRAAAAGADAEVAGATHAAAAGAAAAADAGCPDATAAASAPARDAATGGAPAAAPAPTSGAAPDATGEHVAS